MPQCLRYSLDGFALAVARARRSLLHLFPSIARSSLKNISTRSSQRTLEKYKNSLLMSLLQTARTDRKSTRLNSSHGYISYAVFCLKKKKKNAYIKDNLYIIR